MRLQVGGLGRHMIYLLRFYIYIFLIYNFQNYDIVGAIIISIYLAVGFVCVMQKCVEIMDQF